MDSVDNNQEETSETQITLDDEYSNCYSLSLKPLHTEIYDTEPLCYK